ncbi:LptF/LptG family permease [Devosia sp.]|uniref:LptF/LptG family permease n=1 Tax=Devosia sp. TaxID=1871048 RepID=UPI002F1989DC
MTRLSRYLAKVFAVETAALFAVAAFLLYLIQCLRSFSVVAVKGQDVFTLLGQALLTMPTLGVVFLYVCAGIGLARGLRALQASQELHIIHASRRVPALVGAIGLFAGGWALVVLLLANFVEPVTNRQFNDWAASVAADLVSRTLTPNRFVEVVPGVTMLIGGRGAEGELTNFFADDNRNPAMRRTYLARTATVAADEQGYVLQLRDGAIQHMSADKRFSEVAFARYDMALERLTGPAEAREALGEMNSIDLVRRALAGGNWDRDTIRQLSRRLGEGLRVIAICLFVAAIAAFPHGRRTAREIPLEIVVLAAAFVERGLSSSLLPATPYDPIPGALLLAAGSTAALLARLRVFAPRRQRAAPA